MDPDRLDLRQFVEETFGVLITDEEDRKVRTVGDLHQLVRSRIKPGSERRCLSSITFYRLRRAFQVALGISRVGVLRETPVRDLLPGSHRRAAWQRVAAEAQLTLPALLRPRWLWISLTYAVVGLSLLLAYHIGRFGSRDFHFLLALVGAALTLGLVARWVSRPFAVVPPVATVQDLVASVICLNRQLIPLAGSPSPEDVWPMLVRILETEFKVPGRSIDPATRLANDLGIV